MGPQRRTADPEWAQLPDEELLKVRLCDLGLRIEGSWLEELVETLYGELARKNLRLRPHVWLSSEWFCPDGVPGIAIPFYLVHSRLKRLERRQMLDVEGGSRAECLRLLRHEAGHAIEHAFDLHRRRRWQRVFGRPGLPYPDVYRPNPASRRYVINLDAWYAQSHPYEDFAETFAVWLAPRSAWRRRYRDWPAVKKLEYVDELMGELADRPPKVRTRRQVDPLRSLRQTLREYYDEKRARYAPAYSKQYDRDLRRLFADGRRTRRGRPAAAFLRANRRELRRLVLRWAGEWEATFDLVFQEVVGRCGELRLRAVGPNSSLLTNAAVLLTARTMQYLYRNREWHAL